MNLPLQNFTVAADIGQLYLHEVAITNFQTTVKVDGGHVLVKPFQLVLNGAPVNASVDLDLSVPGYKYNLALNADPGSVGAAGGHVRARPPGPIGRDIDRARANRRRGHRPARI